MLEIRHRKTLMHGINEFKGELNAQRRSVCGLLWRSTRQTRFIMRGERDRREGAKVRILQQIHSPVLYDLVCLQLDLWYVILNGSVEISYGDGRAESLCMGNSFGISPSLDRQFMTGVVCTKADDCQVSAHFCHAGGRMLWSIRIMRWKVIIMRYSRGAQELRSSPDHTHLSVIIKRSWGSWLDASGVFDQGWREDLQEQDWTPVRY